MIKLASEKSFNRGICPVMNIKGKTVTYPFIIEHKTFKFGSTAGILGPKQMMIMDVIGTKLIHDLFGNTSFSDRIPTPKDLRVRNKSGQFMSYKLLKYVAEHLSGSNGGRIPESWYSPDGRLCDIDKINQRIKTPLQVKLNDGVLRKELPFMRKYSSVQILNMISQTGKCVLQMNYPVRFFNGKEYQTFPFANVGFPSRLFIGIEIKETKKSKDNHILEREYTLRFDSILGYAFAQNITSCYMDLLPGKFYELSDYAQLFYRLFMLTYFPNKVSGKTPKNPVSLDEIRKRLALKTKDTYMVRQTVNRILKELEDNGFISDRKEEKIHGVYMYSYRKTSWKDLADEEEASDTELDDIGS
jgi:hypothetical protein